MTVLPDPCEQPTLNVDEVMAAYGMGRSAVYEAARRDEIPSLRKGRAVIFPTAAIRADLSIDTSSIDVAERLRVLEDLGRDIENAATEADAAISRLRETVAAARAVVKTQLSGGPTSMGPTATTTDRTGPGHESASHIRAL